MPYVFLIWVKHCCQRVIMKIIPKTILRLQLLQKQFWDFNYELVNCLWNYVLAPIDQHNFHFKFQSYIQNFLVGLFQFQITKFCTCHNSCVVVTCTKFSVDQWLQYILQVCSTIFPLHLNNTKRIGCRMSPFSMPSNCPRIWRLVCP